MLGTKLGLQGGPLPLGYLNLKETHINMGPSQPQLSATFLFEQQQNVLITVRGLNGGSREAKVGGGKDSE